MSNFASKTLHCQEGTSDKVYQIVLETGSSKDRFNVTAQWGRRGNTLMSQPKATNLSIASAMALMDELLSAKRKKGYKDLDLGKDIGKAAKVQPKPFIPMKPVGILPLKSPPAPPPIPKQEDSFVSVGNTSRRIKD